MRLIILDRDGVINQDSDAFIKSPDEWHPVPGSVEAIALLTQANWRVVIASNQSGIARGLFTTDALNSIHQKMRQTVTDAGGRLDAIFVCPHGPDDGCLCRKPRPGLFHDISRRYETSLTGVPAVGDSLRDLQAAAEAGCSPWLVTTGNGTKTRTSSQLPEGIQIRDNLLAVVHSLLNEAH